MTRDEEILAAIIQQFGYVTIFSTVPLKIGQAPPNLMMGTHPPDTKAKFRVIGESNREEAVEVMNIVQSMRGDPRCDYSCAHKYFYRINTD